jgi:hypothetical protein
MKVEKIIGWITYGIAPVGYLEKVDYLSKTLWITTKKECEELYGFGSN